MRSGSLRRLGADSKLISGAWPKADALATSASDSRGRRIFFMAASLLSALRVQQDFLHPPHCDFRCIQLVFAVAVQLVYRAELAWLLAGFSELTDDGAIQFHFENVASHR